MIRYVTRFTRGKKRLRIARYTGVIMHMAMAPAEVKKSRGLKSGIPWLSGSQKAKRARGTTQDLRHPPEVCP